MGKVAIKCTRLKQMQAVVVTMATPTGFLLAVEKGSF